MFDPYEIPPHIYSPFRLSLPHTFTPVLLISASIPHPKNNLHIISTSRRSIIYTHMIKMPSLLCHISHTSKFQQTV